MQNKFLKISSEHNKSIVFLTLLFLIFIGSCKKSEVKKPKLFFVTSNGFVFSNDSMMQSDSIRIGVNCFAGTEEDPLRILNISKSDNNSGDTTLKKITIPTASNSNFNYILRTTVAVKSLNTRKYTFTLISESGLVSQINVSIKTKYY